ncbi:hypothetical protein ACJRO7_025333 [Eucalyptus globulus]|uniref:Uncharacterized protein n=1 Tax=Eucalyptus globulus TaxID=34317 RepID=A0ABD3KH55_EUCGL
MGKESKRPVLGAASIICLLIAVSLCVSLLVSKDLPFLSWRIQIPNWRGNNDAREVDKVNEEGDALKNLLRRLVREERNQFEIEGFTCHFDLRTEICLSAKPVRISSGGLTVHVLCKGSQFERSVQPYARRDDERVMKPVTPCPSGDLLDGHYRNAFHEFSEIIIPLFLPCQHLRSQMKFVTTNHDALWIQNHLSGYEASQFKTVGVFTAFQGQLWDSVVQVVWLGQDWTSANSLRSPHSQHGCTISGVQDRAEWELSVGNLQLQSPGDRNPGSIYVRGGYKKVRAVYVDCQDAKINLARFNETFVEAMRPVVHSTTSG